MGIVTDATTGAPLGNTNVYLSSTTTSEGKSMSSIAETAEMLDDHAGT